MTVQLGPAHGEHGGRGQADQARQADGKRGADGLRHPAVGQDVEPLDGVRPYCAKPNARALVAGRRACTKAAAAAIW